MGQHRVGSLQKSLQGHFSVQDRPGSLAVPYRGHYSGRDRQAESLQGHYSDKKNCHSRVQGEWTDLTMVGGLETDGLDGGLEAHGLRLEGGRGRI